MTDKTKIVLKYEVLKINNIIKELNI